MPTIATTAFEFFMPERPLRAHAHRAGLRWMVDRVVVQGMTVLSQNCVSWPRAALVGRENASQRVIVDDEEQERDE
jgi:hypothetical protein